MSTQTVLVMLLVGLVAGWLAGKIVRGTGFGPVGDVVIGIVGAFIGNWLLLRLGIHLGVGLVRAILSATIGAVLLLLVVGFIRRGSGWRGYGWRGYGWGRRWSLWGGRRYW